MQAITQRRYGAPLEALRLEDLPTPEPGEGQVLIDVRASSVNAYDWHMVTGIPKLGRLGGMGVRVPKHVRAGRDVAGTVRAVGPGVTDLRVGDEVFGGATGAFAEQVVGHARELAVKPAAVSFEQAASLSMAGTTALQALRDHAAVQPGQRVLITGASGGVGSFAVQIAKHLGAHVTAVCGPANVDAVRELGADDVVDHTREDALRRDTTWDSIVDLAGRPSILGSRRRLSDGGVLVLTSGDGGSVLGPIDRMVGARLVAAVTDLRVSDLLAAERRDDLAQLARWVVDGAVRPHIVRTWSLAETPQAVDLVWQGHPGGKHVISV